MGVLQHVYGYFTAYTWSCLFFILQVAIFSLFADQPLKEKYQFHFLLLSCYSVMFTFFLMGKDLLQGPTATDEENLHMTMKVVEVLQGQYYAYRMATDSMRHKSD